MSATRANAVLRPPAAIPGPAAMKGARIPPSAAVALNIRKGTMLTCAHAGPWAAKLAPGLAPKVSVTRQPLAWVQPKKWPVFDHSVFPCWLIRNGDRDFYGFPIVPAGQFGGPLGLKLGMHHPGGEVTDPDKVDRSTRAQDENALVEFLDAFLPDGYERTLVMKTCLYTKTQDEHFIVDFIPGYDEKVVIATGFSGHGFKFASVIGEIVSDLASRGSTELPIGFLRADRF